MKARWLWESWALLAVAGIVAMEAFAILFGRMFLIPKLQYFSRQDWMRGGDSTAAACLSWASAFLRSLGEVCDHTILTILAFAGLWGLFEWRVRSENKSLMRLAGFGTLALALMVILVLTSAALIVSMQLAIPGIVTRPPEQVVQQQVSKIDDAVGALEQSVAKRRWPAAGQEVGRASREMNKLASLGAAAPALSALHDQAKINEFRARLTAANDCLQKARDAILTSDWDLLRSELQEFRRQYAAIHEAATAIRPAAGR
jgi:hypothetical protein